jgi:PST family polysaccharide transporter
MLRPGPHTRKALNSSVWLLGERAVALLLNLIVSILLARYLGPRDYGSLSYAIAFIALLATIPYLGFGAVVVQELVREPDKRGETMGVVLYSKIAASFLAFFLANLISQLVVDEPRDRILIFLVSFSMIFDAVGGLRTHFESLTESRSVVLVSSASNLAGAMARLVAVAVAAPLWVFAVVVSIQSALAGLGYAAVYKRSVGPTSRLAFSLDRARSLFGKSWPLIIGTAAYTIYLKIDQFMLGQMRDMVDVGTYAIAARLSEVWYVVPIAIVSSIFPRIVELRAQNTARYRQRLRESIRGLFWMGVLIALPVSIVAVPLITFLFGPAYSISGTILAIHIWACPAVFMGIAVEKWLVAEDLLKFFIGRQLMGAALNVILNLVLIPKFGGVGSAIATLISYTFAYYFACFTSSRTRPAAIWMSEAIVWPVLWAVERRRASA